jgi:hypothetical protein
MKEFKGTKPIPRFYHLGKEVVYKRTADELLKALQRLVESPYTKRGTYVRAQAKEAINKALGE